jgi:hypothetical protein
MKISVYAYTYILPWQKEHVWCDLCEKHDGQMGLLVQQLHCIILSAPMVVIQQIQQEFAPSTSYTSFAPSTSYSPGSGLISICAVSRKREKIESDVMVLALPAPFEILCTMFSKLFRKLQRFNILSSDKEDYWNEIWLDKEIWEEVKSFLLLPVFAGMSKEKCCVRHSTG